MAGRAQLIADFLPKAVAAADASGSRLASPASPHWRPVGPGRSDHAGSARGDPVGVVAGLGQDLVGALPSSGAEAGRSRTAWPGRSALAGALDDTRAATAQVGRIAAIIRAGYAESWPETVPALIVDFAGWQRAVLSHLRGAGEKRVRAKPVRR
jgi:hypothetical protein